MANETSDRPISVGISGLGRAGWDLHARTLREMTDRFRIAAVCDGLADRREQATTELGARAYSTFAELVADDEVELVVVAVPSHAHAEQATEALAAGKHVLVEKPFATSFEQAAAMFEASTQADRLLIASQNMRFEAGFLRIKELVESGRLGEIVQIRVAWQNFRRRWDWQTLRKLGGGALGNDGTHVIDQVLLLIDEEVEPVFSRLAHTPLSLGDAEDYAKIILSGPEAPVVDLEFSSACAYPGDQWLVAGTRGSLAGGHGKYRAKYIDPDLLQHREVSPDPTSDRGYGKEDLPWVEETFDVSTETYTMSHRRLYGAIHDSLRNGAAAPVSPKSVLRQLEIIEKTRAVAGQIVEVAA
ncbi:oxidoreductase [Leifsonia sp. LS1]|uniref:Gfo/Idh/MocA family protein n=1 Tax=Leifsonia sp. LS1 TaxID=2828483 RepID=UPI001CFEE058|nr:Gfo/Idh/MocA family oxidoreductase [Leifsonia sp. LS1]GIT82196.1 oxidoreductase [Leifsonia sp. LS1]